MSGDLKQAETAILTRIHEESGIAPAKLITTLTAEGIREDAVRAAMWELINRRKVELSKDLRNLTLGATQGV